MNKIEHLLNLLMEECCEVAQQASKAIRFGINEQRDLPTTNAERLQIEFNDLLAVVELINEEVGYGMMYKDSYLITKKKLKVDKYTEYSRMLGTLKDE